MAKYTVTIGKRRIKGYDTNFMHIAKQTQRILKKGRYKNVRIKKLTKRR